MRSPISTCNVKDPEQGRGEAEGVHIFLQIRRPVVFDLQCRDVGCYPPYRTVPGVFPSLGVTSTDGEDSTAEIGQEVGLHLRRGGERGGRVRYNGKIHP